MFSAKPFSNRTEKKFSLYEKFKMIFMTITFISIIRFILFYIFAILLILSMIITHLGFSIYDKNNVIQNIHPIRRFFCFLNQLFARACLFILGYYWIRETKKDNTCLNYPSYLENNNVKIILSNHISFLDSLYFLSRGSYYFLASAKLLKMFLIGRVLKNAGAIFVPTNEEEKKIYADPNKVIRDIITSSNITRPLLIFPEGTVKQNDYLYNFQLGAFRPLSPVRPVILNFKHKHCDPSWTFSHSATYIIFRLCCQFVNFLDVKYLGIYSPDNENSVEFKNKIEKVYLEKSPNLKKINLSVNDTHFYGKLFEINKDLANYAYDIYLDKSIVEYNIDKKELIERINKRFNEDNTLK